MASRAWVRYRRTVLRSAALSLSAAQCLVAQTAAQEPGPAQTFVEAVDVRVVEVEVVVTDRRGNPVLGLTRDDFQIFEDGDPLEVTNFYAVEAGRRLPDPAVADDPDVVTPPPGKSYLVVVVDSANLAPTARTRVLRELEERLDRLVDVTTGVMVVNLGQGLKIENRFTRDRALLRDSVERILGSAKGLRSSMDRNIVLRGIENGVDPSSAQGASPDVAEAILENAESDGVMSLNSIHSYVAQIRFGIEDGHRRLKTLIASLAGLEGRKAILYVSSGYENRLGEALYRRWWDKYESIANRVGVFNIESEINRDDITHQIQGLMAHSAANSAVFYCLGTGLDSYSAISAEIRTTGTASVLQELIGNEAGVLETLAFGTGGLALTTSNNVDHLIDGMARGLESYYSLGYSSPQRGDGQRRSIQVRISNPDLVVRYARSYLDKSDEDLMKERTLAALLLDEAANPLAISVELGEARRSGDGKYVLPVLVKIPIASLTLLPEGDHHVARISLVFVAQDERGTSDPVHLSLPIDIPNAQLLTALSQFASYAAELALRPGEQKLAIGVRDEIAELDSTLNVVANAGRAADGPR